MSVPVSPFAVRVAAAYAVQKLAAEMKADILRRLLRWRAWDRKGAERTTTVQLGKEHRVEYGILPTGDGEFYAIARMFWGEDSGGHREFVDADGRVHASPNLAATYAGEDDAAKAIAAHAEDAIRKHGLPKPSSVWDSFTNFFRAPDLSAPGPMPAY